MSENINTQFDLDEHGKSYSKFMVMFVILLATFAGALMQTSLGTALPTLMKDFDIDWFLLANGIMVPLSAYLATRFSTKWLHVIAYAILLVGLILTAIAPSNSDS